MKLIMSDEKRQSSIQQIKKIIPNSASVLFMSVVLCSCTSEPAPITKAHVPNNIVERTIKTCSLPDSVSVVGYLVLGNGGRYVMSPSSNGDTASLTIDRPVGEKATIEIVYSTGGDEFIIAEAEGIIPETGPLIFNEADFTLLDNNNNSVADCIEGSIDSDGDTLFDEDEVDLGLNPTDPDTDKDGYEDNIDRFPNNFLVNADADDDGVADFRDTFPDDASETADLNGDGLGDNSNPIEGTSISGTVFDAVNGAVVGDALVSLAVIDRANGKDAVVRATTDGTGAFSINVPIKL